VRHKHHLHDTITEKLAEHKLPTRSDLQFLDKGKMHGSQQEVVKFEDILRSQKVENHYVLCTTNQSKGVITITKAMVIQETMIVTVSERNKT